MSYLVDKQICTGCGACVNICPKLCIQMKADSEGFLYPEIDLNLCVDCGRCTKSCPVLEFKNDSVEKQPVSMAAYCGVDAILEESSSGGVFSVLAKHIIDSNGVVYGAVLSDELKVKHIRVASKEQLRMFRGSKYVQSEIGNTYRKAKEDLLNGINVLYSGTPCQIAGLKTFLGKKYDNLLCVDIICHSVPSPGVWNSFIRQIEEKNCSSIASVNFRDKRESWDNYCFSATLSNGTEVVLKGQDNYYMRAFLNGLSTRPSCNSCKFKGQSRASDITIGDFWGCMSVCPEFANKKGTSLVLLQTQKGKSIFNEIKGQLNTFCVNYEQALSYNPAYFCSSKSSHNRDEFFRCIDSESFDLLVERLTIPSVEKLRKHKRNKNLINRIIRKIKTIAKSGVNM